MSDVAQNQPRRRRVPGFSRGGSPGKSVKSTGGAADTDLERTPSGSLPALTKASKTSTACSFFNTPKGCRNGDECPFVHDSGSMTSNLDVAATSQKKKRKPKAKKVADDSASMGSSIASMDIDEFGTGGEGNREEAAEFALSLSKSAAVVEEEPAEEELTSAVVLLPETPAKSTTFDSIAPPPFLILECQVPEDVVISPGDPNRSRSFTVVHENRFYEVISPPGAQPGEVINVIVLPDTIGHQLTFSSPTSASSTPRSASISSASRQRTCSIEHHQPLASSQSSLYALLLDKLHEVDQRLKLTERLDGVRGSAVSTLTALNDTLAHVEQRLKLTERLEGVRGSALSTLTALNDTLVVKDMTLLQWLEELMFFLRKRLGTMVTIAVQVDNELKIRHSIACRVVQLQETLEPHVDNALQALRDLDARIAGGGVGRVLLKAAHYVPPSILRKLPDSLLEAMAVETIENQPSPSPAPSPSRVCVTAVAAKSIITASCVVQPSVPMNEVKKARVVHSTAHTPLRSSLVWSQPPVLISSPDAAGSWTSP